MADRSPASAPTALDDYVAELLTQPRLVYTRHALKMAQRAVELEGDTWLARRFIRGVKWILAQPRRDPTETIDAIGKLLTLSPSSRIVPMAELTGFKPEEAHSERGAK
jgi:hypothetical protein